tara:strand:+ start:6248 stop:6967 length:720 start_codon:yes stop_codon:yes gene_type:complete
MKAVIFAGALAALAGTASAGTVIASTSFENATVDGQYVDLGDASVDHDLVNNAGQSMVDFLNDGVEMGFDAYYRNTRNDVGLTDGDFVGATNFAGQVGAFTDGVQGYELSDADGTMGLSFDTVNFAGSWGMSMDIFVNESGWEADDSIHIWVEVDGGTTLDLINTTGSDIDDLGIEAAWQSLSVDLSSYTTATLFVELESNSGSENLYLDNVVFSAVPTPGALALLGLGGLVGARRRRA